MTLSKCLLFCCVITLAGCDSQDDSLAGPSAEEANAASRRLVINLNMHGKPAIEEPAEEDKGWKDPSYDTLIPSREDGEPTFSNNWFDTNEHTWAQVLNYLKGVENLRYLEVGVFEGQSFLWMFKEILTHPSSTAVAIDVFFFEGLEERFYENLERAGIKDRVETIKAFSNVGLRPLKPESFDVIYIDGSHTGANVLRDGILSWDLLKEGGILIFDDYGLRPRFPAAIRPGPVIDMMLTAFYKEVEVLSRGWQVMLKKRPTDCYDNCSMLGPYYYHWNYREPDKVGTGTLVDPRTAARVPLTVEERTTIEALILARPIGQTFIAPSVSLWQKPATQALMQKLKLL